MAKISRILLSALLTLAAVTFSAVVPLPADHSALSAKSVHKDFKEAWEKRYERYEQEWQVLDQSARDTVAKYVAALEVEGADMEQEGAKLKDAMHRASYLYGRYWVLSQLRKHMDDKPSSVSSELWMQEKVSEVQADARTADLHWAQLNEMPPDTALMDALSKFESAVVGSARVQGVVDELTLIDQNLASYYQGRSKERANRSRIFSAIGSALMQSSNQATFAPTVQTRCSTYGGITNCKSN